MARATASLGAAGAYKPEMTGSAQRILHHAVVEKLVIGSDGTMVPVTPGSTRPAAEVRRHAGPLPVEKWTFHLPWRAEPPGNFWKKFGK